MTRIEGVLGKYKSGLTERSNGNSLETYGFVGSRPL